MKVHSISYGCASYGSGANDGPKSWTGIPQGLTEKSLVLIFADRSYEEQPLVWQQLREQVNGAVVLGCSTAGGIAGGLILPDTIAGVAVEFESTCVALAEAAVEDRSRSFEAGREIGEQLARQSEAQAGRPLKALFVVSDGLAVNGTELAAGLHAGLPAGVTVSGGLAGDGSLFQRTWIMAGKHLGPHRAAAVGFYGEHIQFSYGSQGGWDKFGIERKVTKVEGSVLYELDGKPALKLYKEYLGERAEGLPATGLLFPLGIRSSSDPQKVIVRTILQVDEQTQSLTFAGDIPVGSYAQLMKANFDRLVQGAAGAAEQTLTPDTSGEKQTGDSLAVAVSCVGRKLVLGSRAEDELDATLGVLPPGTIQVGFYSYGELAPGVHDRHCHLHNQTMTVTRFYESVP